MLYRDDIKIEGISRATRSNLIKIYEQLIDRNVILIFDELIQKSKIYNNFVEPDEDNGEYHRGLNDLLRIGAAPSYTFLIYLFSEHRDNDELIDDSIEFLIKYFVRRNLTDFPATRDLDKIFMDLIDECEKNKSYLGSSHVITFLTHTDRFANLELFKERLEGDIYEDNIAIARFILSLVEEKRQTTEIYRDLWERDKSRKYIWTIEHIFPEGQNVPKEWVDMIALGDNKSIGELQAQWVHKLGNLTLTGYNSNLSNLPFDKKRDRKDKSDRYIGYRNGLYLNKELADKDSWTIPDIKERTRKLAREALELFQIEGEQLNN